MGALLLGSSAGFLQLRTARFRGILQSRTTGSTSVLLFQEMRSGSFVLDGCVSLGLGWLWNSRAFALSIRDIEGALLWLLMWRKRGKSSGPCCANSISDFRKFEVSYNVGMGVVLDKGLVERCLANVGSGKRQVGEEDEAGHRLADSASLGSGDHTRWIHCCLHR